MRSIDVASMIDEIIPMCVALTSTASLNYFLFLNKGPEAGRFLLLLTLLDLAICVAGLVGLAIWWCYHLPLIALIKTDMYILNFVDTPKIVPDDLTGFEIFSVDAAAAVAALLNVLRTISLCRSFNNARGHVIKPGVVAAAAILTYLTVQCLLYSIYYLNDLMHHRHFSRTELFPGCWILDACRVTSVLLVVVMCNTITTAKLVKTHEENEKANEFITNFKQINQVY